MRASFCRGGVCNRRKEKESYRGVNIASVKSNWSHTLINSSEQLTMDMDAVSRRSEMNGIGTSVQLIFAHMLYTVLRRQ